MHPPFFKIMDEIQEGLRYVFQTSSKFTLLISSSGHGGERSIPMQHAPLCTWPMQDCMCQPVTRSCPCRGRKTHMYVGKH
jgi:hypothetical protein